MGGGKKREYAVGIPENAICGICALSIFSPKMSISTKITKNYQTLMVFRCFKFLKTQNSSFKNDFIFVFHLDITKSIKKNPNLIQYQKMAK